MIDYPNKLNIIFEKLKKLNIKPIIIGGFIRDKLLNIASSDIDIELYGINSLLEIEEILQEFGKVTSVGKSFGICKLFFEDLELDFSLPRTDSKVALGHKGIEVSTNKNLDFKTACSRRDFTINAIGYNIQEKRLLDPFHGKEDLQKKILRAVDLKKFSEDPLRVLRALVFASRFHFTLDKQLFLECQSMIHRHLLEELPKERIFNELKKLLLKSKKPSYGFSLLKKIDGFLYFNEFLTISEKKYEVILSSLNRYKNFNITDEKTTITSFLALLSYYFTEQTRASFLKRLTHEKTLISNIHLFINIAHILDIEALNDYKVYSLATKLSIKDFTPFLRALFNDKEKIIIENLENRAKKLDVFEKELPALLGGKDLLKKGLKPSKKFSDILERAYNLQIEKKLKTKEVIFKYLKKENYLN